MNKTLADDHWLETYKSLISLSMEGFKFAALINGGAAVAILAYLGNIFGKGAVPDMRCPMAAFLAGLVLCGFSMFFAYLTQLRLLDEERRGDEPPRHHIWFLSVSAILFLASLVSFCVGSWVAVTRFA